jgi:hypothetical protein
MNFRPGPAPVCFLLKLGGRAMTNCDSQNPHPPEWRGLYRAAIFETDSYKMVKRISEAEAAIAKRLHELSWETGADVEGEREALDDAMYGLSAWRSTLEMGTRTA